MPKADIAIITVIEDEYRAVLSALERRGCRPTRDLGSTQQPNQYGWVAGELKDDAGRVYQLVVAFMGYFDPYPRWPYCRVTAFTRDDEDGWRAVLPLICRMSAAYRDALPDGYKVQRAFVERTSSDFRIEGSQFTTVTVNLN
jgi:hypothetical protein